MTHTGTGDWPTGLMTSHHSYDRFCSSGGKDEDLKTNLHLGCVLMVVYLYLCVCVLPLTLQLQPVLDV